jgi:hypothetical protein
MGCGGGKAQAQAHTQVQDATKFKALTGKAKASPSGKFPTMLPPSGEGLRDFARIFFANDRKIFIAAEGMPSMRPLQPTVGPSSSHIGDLNEQVVERATSRFTEVVTAQLTQVFGTAPDPACVERLCSKAMLAMTVNVGLDFALHMEMLPSFLQPVFLIIVLGEPMQARVATYGFVAQKPEQIKGDRPESKRTPICVRLLSPDLMADREEQASDWHVDYKLWEVRTTTILQAAEGDMESIRAAANTGSWQPLC